MNFPLVPKREHRWKGDTPLLSSSQEQPVSPNQHPSWDFRLTETQKTEEPSRKRRDEGWII